jgi:Telomere resolvase
LDLRRLDLQMNWLEVAVSHGVTKWLKDFLRAYLPCLREQELAPEAFASAFDAELRLRGLFSLAQQKNPRSNVVQAIKSFDDQHPAIELVGLTTEQYRALNDAQRGRLADRETRFFTSEQAEILVQRAKSLLDSTEWSEVGAGLAVLLGRRISEILLSQFQPCSDWSVLFSQMAKKKGEVGLSIEIPTLAPAVLVLQAVQKLQQVLRVDDLVRDTGTRKGAYQAVNQRYSNPIVERCQFYFADLVPPRSDRDGLYTHVFRSVYATIAVHWFCPMHIPEHAYKAEIQGHFTLAQDGRKLPNFSARANYDDYAIVTPDGQRDGRMGLKLGTLPGLEVIAVFRGEQAGVSQLPATPIQLAFGDDLRSEPLTFAPWTEGEIEDMAKAKPIAKPTEKTTENPPAKPKTRRPELLVDDLHRMTELMAIQGVTGTTAEVFHALVAAFAQQHKQQTQSVSDLNTNFAWFTRRIDELEQTCQQLRQERDQLKSHQPSTQVLQQLQVENRRLTTELQQTRQRLEGIQKLLGGTTPVPPPSSLASSGNGYPQEQQMIAPLNPLPTPLPQPTTPSSPATSPSSLPLSGSLPRRERIPGVPSRRNRNETDTWLNQIIDALISWNSAQESSLKQLRISIPVIKALATLVGASYQAAIQECLLTRNDELEEHHSRLLLGSRHNASIRNKEVLLQTIARDYLGLENWQSLRA